MKRFRTDVPALLLALALMGVAWAQQKSTAQKSAPTNTPPPTEAKSESKTTVGRISSVDAKTKTMTVTDGNKSMTFVWDEKTKVTEAGHAVKRSAIVSGAHVTVHYTSKGGKNWASAIVITPTSRAAKHR